MDHIRWEGDRLLLLDQRLLPQEVYRTCETAEDVARCIREMVVRGAPAIGIVAALGVALAAKRDPLRARERALEAIGLLSRTRPTARNLFFALERMEGVIRSEPKDLPQALEAEAMRIWQEDLEANRAIGRYGAELLPEGSRVLTHCNAGALATGGYGTALGIIRRAFELGKVKEVLASETRPFLQGARLTAWELKKDGIPVRIVVEGAVGYLMAKGMVDAVVVGADRVTARGDIANKIGTYNLAYLAKGHGIPFYVAAPMSTFDLQLLSGDEIPIEERDPEEVLSLGGRRVAPEGVEALNPSFDVTPAELITAIVTERGVLWPPL